VGVTATNILLSEDGKRAIGVEFAQEMGAQKWIAHTNKEVILSAGTIGTPQLLMLSGIGPREELEKHDIPVLVDLPGVGQNLTDHLACGAVYYVKKDSLEYLKHEAKSMPAFLQ
jgi:choline dehydrogenase